MLRTRPLSTHNYTPLSPRIISICNPFNLNFLNISAHNEACLRLFETNPETCFVHDGLCPPTTTPISISPRIISICNPFNLNFFNISAHNEACLRLILKHASYTASAHPQLYPPFPQHHLHLHPFNLNFLNISAHNEASLRLILKHASYTASVHPQLYPPFPPASSPSPTPSTSISWIFQPTTKHVWD